MSGIDVELLSAVTSGLAVVACGVLKYAIDRRDKEIDEKLKEAKLADDKQKLADDEQKKQLIAEVKELTKQNHVIELEHAKLTGEVKVLIKTIEPIERDLKDIRDDMVPRAEWREAQERIESAQGRLETKLDNFARYQQWRPTPSGGMRSQPQSIPREEFGIDEYKTPEKPSTKR